MVKIKQHICKTQIIYVNYVEYVIIIVCEPVHLFLPGFCVLSVCLCGFGLTRVRRRMRLLMLLALFL